MHTCKISCLLVFRLLRYWSSIGRGRRRICDCVCINQPFSTKVEFSAGAKVVNTLPFYAYISKSENPNNITVESLNKKLKTSAYSVYKSLFNGVLISKFIKCAICLVYANMVTYGKTQKYHIRSITPVLQDFADFFSFSTCSSL